MPRRPRSKHRSLSPTQPESHTKTSRIENKDNFHSRSRTSQSRSACLPDHEPQDFGRSNGFLSLGSPGSDSEGGIEARDDEQDTPQFAQWADEDDLVLQEDTSTGSSKMVSNFLKSIGA
jgi:hypothetical protein